MQFEKGRNKTGGRQVGTPNKSSSELRNQLQSVVQSTLNELPELLTLLEPIDRARLLTALLPYVMPKLNSIELKAEQKEDQPKRGKPEWLGMALKQSEKIISPTN
ncbi:hypothetical protein GCM10027592_03380 [Spirosoma flavus]